MLPKSTTALNGSSCATTPTGPDTTTDATASSSQVAASAPTQQAAPRDECLPASSTPSAAEGPTHGAASNDEPARLCPQALRLPHYTGSIVNGEACIDFVEKVDGGATGLVIDLPISSEDRMRLLDRSRAREEPMVRFRTRLSYAEFQKPAEQGRIASDEERIELLGDWILETADGVILAAHFTNPIGFAYGDDHLGYDKAAEMGEFIEDSVKTFPRGAPIPPVGDRRHEPDLGQREVIEEQQGVSHFGWWTGTGQQNAAAYGLSRDAKGSPEQEQFLQRSADELAPFIELAHKLYFILDEKSYHEVVKQYRVKLKGGIWSKAVASLSNALDDSADAMLTVPSQPNPYLMTQCMFFTHNVQSLAHQDRSDARDVLTPMGVTGDFAGGQLSLSQFGLYSEYRAGDMTFLRTRWVTHAIGPVSGVRHGVMFIWRQDFWSFSCARNEPDPERRYDWTSIKSGLPPQFGVTAKDQATRREMDNALLSAQSTRPRSTATDDSNSGRRAKRLKVTSK
ncbi:hypothetical protein JCM10908_006013 [Rhodotorula pacifica]|uniref:uncharacterized protein n=1 Tax=Rhodotorula pacifica TaxID=1495444 RepID=UPI003170509F